jgi:acyl-coenzyme A synthetase/AMP-(fatty) acid ligase
VIAAKEISLFCTEKLPAYMRPVKVAQFAELPRNANGKVDRRAVKTLMEQADHS